MAVLQNAFQELGSGLSGFKDTATGAYHLAQNLANPNVNYLGKTNPGIAAGAASIAPIDLNAAHAQGQQVQQQNQAAAAQASASGQYDPQAAAKQQADLASQYADQASQLQGQYGFLDNQLQNGQQTINNSYGQSAQSLADQQALLQRQYDANKAQNTQDYNSTANNARTQVRSQSQALQRLLGMNGAGNSSASYEQAPYAAALQGSQLINNAQSTYAKNAANTDNNWAQTQLSAKQAKQKLDQSKTAQEQKLQQDVANSRATLLDQIRQANINHDLALGKDYKTAAAAQAGTQAQVQSLLQQIQSLGRVAPITADPQQIQYQTPDMAQYSLEGMAAPQTAQNGQQSNIDPSFLSLLSDPTKKRDQFGQLTTA
jgi:hypothetical protein